MPLTAGMTEKEVRGDEYEKKDTYQGKNKEIRDSPLETKVSMDIFDYFCFFFLTVCGYVI